MCRFFVAGLGLLLLSGCAPHPAAGVWEPVEAAAPFTRIDVQFNGRADFFEPGNEKETLHCFWAAHSKDEAWMNCVPAEHTEHKIPYRLATRGSEAVLEREGKVVMRLRRVE